MKLIVAVTGASGSIYAATLLHKLVTVRSQIEECGVVFSKTGKEVWEYELNDAATYPQINTLPFRIYDEQDFYAPFASGSSGYDAMIIIPCSMGTLGRIAAGISENLITRAADVMLKEKKKLILVTRETPLNKIHLNNMSTVHDAGGIIFPATPAFYNKPETLKEMADSFIDRVLSTAGMQINLKSWGTKQS